MGAFDNIWLWIGTSFGLMVILIILLIFLIFVFKKTHALVEFKAWFKGQPIALFFNDNRALEWRPVKTSCGIVEDKDYGYFIINEQASYVDKTTKNLMLPFVSSIGVGVNVKAAKLVDDIGYVAQDQEKLKMLREAIANNQVSESATIQAIKSTVNIGAIKSMMTAIVPHNIESKINQIVASRLKNYGKVNTNQVILMFVAILGAILIGGMMIKLMFPNN